MRKSLSLAFLMCFAVSLQAGDKIELKAEKGATVSYRSHTKSESKFEFGERQGENASERKADYTIRVAEKKDDVTHLEVVLTALKESRSGGGGFGGGGGELDFDSSKKEDAEGTEGYRALIGRKLTVVVDGAGQVTEIQGLPEPAAREDDDRAGGRRGRFGPRGPVGEREIRGDLQTILASGVQGKDLTAGETYRVGPERAAGGFGRGADRGGRPGGGEGGRGQGRRRPEGEGQDLAPLAPLAPQDDPRPRRGGQDGAGRGGQDGAGRGRGQQGRGFGGGVELKFIGSDEKQINFEVTSRPFGGFGRGGDEAPEPEKVGTASYSKVDGLLLKLESTVERSMDNDRGKFSSRTRVVTERLDAAAKPAAKKAATF